VLALAPAPKPRAGLPQVQKPRRGTAYPPREPPTHPEEVRLCLIEATTPENRGSMGAQYILSSLRAAGYRPEVTTLETHASAGPFDIELVSVHHCTDFPRLAALPRRGKVRIVGGHPSTNNIRPAIPFADVLCIGEGEEWVVRAVDRLAAGGQPRDLADLPGTIVRSQWEYGAPIPATNTVEPLPKHPPYLNRAGEGHAPNWYLEMARGCPFACHYCELGWAWKYRPQDTDYLLAAIDRIDTRRSKRISLFAPDEASHPGYAACLERIHARGLITSFGSMRLDAIVRQNLPLRPNMLVRVGLDGLTEETRFRVKKPIRDRDVVEYFRYMSERGHANFKVFVVCCYPWEKPHDVDAFAQVFEQVRRIPRKASAHVRMKFTPFIPQPSTPLGDQPPSYDPEIIGRILQWLAQVKAPRSLPGWYFANDGIMSARSHALQCQLTLGDERLLIEQREDWSACETLRGYDL
jgi:radical SAM superfamily enzyme YgiQ (UPF0313 family)